VCFKCYKLVLFWMDVVNITFFLQFFVPVKRLVSMLHTCGYDVTWGNLLQPMEIRGCLFAPICLSIGQQKMDNPKSCDTITQKPQYISSPYCCSRQQTGSDGFIKQWLDSLKTHQTRCSILG
jgi:hypothetical protein